MKIFLFPLISIFEKDDTILYEDRGRCIIRKISFLQKKNVSDDLYTWNKKYGHCNKSDIKSYTNLRRGLK